MRVKARAIFVSVIMLLICLINYLPAEADWQWVGTLKLSSNVERKDYVDLGTIVYDKNNKTIIYWVLSVVTDKDLTTKSYERFMTKLDEDYKTKVLEFHINDANDQPLMFSKEGWEDPTWRVPEEISLLQRAIDMVLEKLEGNQKLEPGQRQLTGQIRKLDLETGGKGL